MALKDVGLPPGLLKKAFGFLLEGKGEAQALILEGLAEKLQGVEDAAFDEFYRTIKAGIELDLNPIAYERALKAAEDEARKQAHNLITRMTSAQLQATGKVVADGLQEGIHPFEMARRMTNVQGLDTPRYLQLEKFRKYLDGLDVPQARKDEMLARKKEKLLRARRKTIARTEANFAQSAARNAEAVGEKKKWKAWQTNGDDRVDPVVCATNEKAGVIPADDKFPSGHTTTPGHPNCRCRIVYVSSNFAKAALEQESEKWQKETEEAQEAAKSPQAKEKAKAEKVAKAEGQKEALKKAKGEKQKAILTGKAKPTHGDRVKAVVKAQKEEKAKEAAWKEQKAKVHELGEYQNKGLVKPELLDDYKKVQYLEEQKLEHLQQTTVAAHFKTKVAEAQEKKALHELKGEAVPPWVTGDIEENKKLAKQWDDEASKTAKVMFQKPPEPKAEAAKTKPSEVVKAAAEGKPKKTTVTAKAPKEENLERIGAQQGSNVGGLYQDKKTGKKWYVKTPPTADHARNEALANRLYRDIGVEVPNVQLMKFGNQTAVASEWKEGLTQDPEWVKRFGAFDQTDFVADAYLGNWDVVGQDFDNLQRTKEGTAFRVDAGGALRYRAQGEKKGAYFGDQVLEINTLRDSGRNWRTAEAFKDVKDDDIVAGIDKVTKALTPGKIRKALREFGPEDKAEWAALEKTLVARRDYLLDLKKKIAPSKLSKAELEFKAKQAASWEAFPTQSRETYFEQRARIFNSNRATTMEKEVADDYSRSAYTDINGYLRRGDEPKKSNVGVGAWAYHLEKVIKKGKLQGNAEVWRGMHGGKFCKALHEVHATKGNLRGEVLMDHGFLSTSFEESISRGSYFHGRKGDQFRVLYRLKAEDGTPCVPCNSGEAEMVFQHDSRILVEDSYPDPQDRENGIIVEGVLLKTSSTRKESLSKAWKKLLGKELGL